jgi:hypothetical protein
MRRRLSERSGSNDTKPAHVRVPCVALHKQEFPFLPRGTPLHQDFVIALRVLDAFGLPYADAWRMLMPVAARCGVPRPSYSTVRRFLIEERGRKARRSDKLNEILYDLFAGLVPRLV